MPTFTDDQYAKIADLLGKPASTDPNELFGELSGTLTEQDAAVAQAESRVTALSADIDTLTSERDAAQAEAEKAKTDASTAKATLAASATPAALSAETQTALHDSVDALSERAIARGFHANLIKGVVGCFKQGENFSTLAASASSHGRSIVRDVLAVLANGEVAPPTGQQSSNVTLAASIPVKNPPAAGDVDAATIAQWDKEEKDAVTDRYGTVAAR